MRINIQYYIINSNDKSLENIHLSQNSNFSIIVTIKDGDQGYTNMESTENLITEFTKKNTLSFKLPIKSTEDNKLNDSDCV